MKKDFLKGLTMLTLIAVLAVVSAGASANPQSSNKVVADIPFAFSVGYKTFPAGEYSVQTISTASNALMIRSADGKSSALRLSDATEQSKNKQTARLVFNRYGEHYFLAEVWNGIDRTGRQLTKSQEESAIIRELESISANGEPAKNTFERVEVLAALR